MTIESNTFAEACYDQNSIEEMGRALDGPADQTDMQTWNISATKWREQITAALTEKIADTAIPA